MINSTTISKFCSDLFGFIHHLFFLSSIASSSPLILKLLPPRFQSSSGINDHLFLDAVSEWQTRAGQG